MSTIRNDIDQRLGARIRAEREARGWSLADLAARSGVSRAMIHKVERADSSPTAALLAKLSGAFGLSMSALLARAETNPGRFARCEDQPTWVDSESGYVRRQVSPRTDFPADLVRIALPPGAKIPMPAPAYAFQRQLIWVLGGRLVFVEGDLRHELNVGDCLELGPPADCIFRNEGKEACDYAVIVVRKA